MAEGPPNTADSEDAIGVEAIDFSSEADRADCLAAISAARDLIHDCDGTTRDEIVRALVPEENYPLGHNAAAACCKLGGYEEFRQWWWRQRVRPGLKALSDVEAPPPGGSTWRPVDGSDKP